MIFKIASIGIVAGLSIMVVKNERADIAVFISIAAGLAILLSILDYFTDIFNLIFSLTDVAGLSNDMVKYLLKMVGIGYLTEFACDTVTECGSPSLANKISLAGKVIMLCLVIPIIKELIDIIVLLLS